MASLIMGLLAETSIHPGVGRNLGVIDLPVAREAATDYPVIVGSSLKGALKDRAAGAQTKVDCNRLFGEPNGAGQLLISDARIVLLPVRSLTGQYRWVTCPHILERFTRDKQRAGLKSKIVLPTVGRSRAKTTDGTNDSLFLEEREFKTEAFTATDNAIISEIAQLIRNESARERVAKQLVILSNDDFAWFARYGLAVQARNVLDEKTKTSKNLWYEETLPPDTVMYALIAERGGQGLSEFKQIFHERPYLQAGGNETIGQGVFLVCLSQPETKS